MTDSNPRTTLTAYEKQSAFIATAYALAEKLRAGSIRPYPGLLGHGHDLSDEARQDIREIGHATIRR